MKSLFQIAIKKRHTISFTTSGLDPWLNNVEPNLIEETLTEFCTFHEWLLISVTVEPYRLTLVLETYSASVGIHTIVRMIKQCLGEALKPGIPTSEMWNNGALISTEAMNR